MIRIDAHLWRWLGLFVVLACLSIGCEAPEPCKRDDDCAKKEYVCRGEKCVLQLYCEEDSNCEYKGETCNIGKCTLPQEPDPPPLICPEGCLSDNQCSVCKDGRTACVNGACVKQERVKKFERCGGAVGAACEDGLTCTGVTEASRFCFPDCDPKVPRCDDGKAGCYNPLGREKGLCIPDGEATENGACSENFEGEKTLDQSKLCKPGLQCVNKICVVPKVVGDYQLCAPGTKCGENATCVVLSQSSDAGYCLPACDVAKADCNGTSGSCIKLQSGKGACLVKGTGKEDTLCGPQGSTLKPEHLCDTGLQCITLNPKGSVCLKTVTACSETACAQGRACLSGTSGGVCALPCQAGTTQCPTQLTCQALQLGAETVSLCAP